MLVLQRKYYEKVRIGDDVEIIILPPRSGKIRIGIHAPRNVSIVRTEIDDRGSLIPEEWIRDDRERS